MRKAGKLTGNPHKTVHELGIVDALVAAMAERLSGIVYTSDPSDMELLKDAGAAIIVAKVPF